MSRGSPIRVLWLIKGLGPGGAERLLVEQAAVASRDSFVYDVAYLLDWKNHLVSELSSLGVQASSLGVHSDRDPRWLGRLARVIWNGGYDVIHSHSPLVASAARVIAHLMPPQRRPKLVYTEHNRWPSFRLATRAANWLTYPLDDVHLAVSDDVRNSIPARFQAGVEVVLHGINVDDVRACAHERESVRAELGVRDGEVLAITVANLRATKNYPVLFGAAQLVLETGTPVKFAAAGQGPLAGDLRRELDTIGLGDRFRLLGYRRDTTRLIAGADVFVLASRHEGLPVTVMEALTLGVPVVAPAVGGIPEVVATDRTGILVAPNSARALADAIMQIAEPGVRASLAAHAATTGDRFSSTRAVRRIEAIYQALANACPGVTRRDMQ